MGFVLVQFYYNNFEQTEADVQFSQSQIIKWDTGLGNWRE